MNKLIISLLFLLIIGLIIFYNKEHFTVDTNKIKYSKYENDKWVEEQRTYFNHKDVITTDDTGTYIRTAFLTFCF